MATKNGHNINVKYTKPGDKGFLFTHHFFIFAITLNTLKNKLKKLATGKNLKNDFLPMNGIVSQETVNIAKTNAFFHPLWVFRLTYGNFLKYLTTNMGKGKGIQI